jgi:ATP-dependent Clp protease, protease subunit
MPENAMLVLHDPSGLVMGTAVDMRAMAGALDRMKAGMVAAYREKSGRDDAEIEALLRDETWLSAQEAVALGLADRAEEPVRMAAHFDLSRFRNPPPQLVALVATPSPQEDDMSDPKKTSPRKLLGIDTDAALKIGAARGSDRERDAAGTAAGCRAPALPPRRAAARDRSPRRSSRMRIPRYGCRSRPDAGW